MIPGGPGYPPICGTPVLDGLSPLSAAIQANRGATAVIRPPDCDLGETEVDVVDLRSAPGCVNAYLLAVVLGIDLYRTKCDPCTFIQDAFVHVSVRAIIDWGVGGAPFHAECDWLLGTQLSIAAENIRIGARYEKFTLPWDPAEFDEAPSFILSAGFALGNVGRNSNPARYTAIAAIESPGETQRISIPAFATSFTIQPVLGSPVLARKYGFGMGFGVDLSATSPLSNVGQYNVENAIPIANGDRFVEVRNEGTGPALAFVVFGLSL